MSDNQTSGQGSQTIIVNQPARESNGLGLAGFIIALVGFVLCWIPILNLILWFLGLLFSFIGVFKRPKGFAIAGLAISAILIVVIVMLLGAIGAAAVSSGMR